MRKKTNQNIKIENKAVKYRIYPNKEQEILMVKTFGCCRKIWNLMLNDKLALYDKTKSFGKQYPSNYKEEYPFLKEVDSLALANVQLNLEQAFKNCFKHKHCRFPKFKAAKKSRKSYTTNNIKSKNGTCSIEIFKNAIKLPKLKMIKAKIHRVFEGWSIKSVTISKDSDGKYYASVLYEKEVEDKSTTLNYLNSIGLDYKSDGLYKDSNGNTGSNHKFFRRMQKKLGKAQRKLSKMKGNKKNEEKSKNFEKQLVKIAKIYKKISNQRLDNLHKISTEIANHVDIVCVETLNMKAIANKGFKNGKAIYDNGYAKFLELLEYKLKDRNKIFIKVDKFFPSSQICYNCGSKQKLALNERTYICDCGYITDRDENAANNIRREGLRLLGFSI